MTMPSNPSPDPLLADVDGDAPVDPLFLPLPGSVPYPYKDYQSEKPRVPPFPVVPISTGTQVFLAIFLLALASGAMFLCVKAGQARDDSVLWMVLAFWCFPSVLLGGLSFSYWLMDRFPIVRHSYSAEEVRHSYKLTLGGFGRDSRKVLPEELPSLEAIAAYLDLERLARERVRKSNWAGRWNIRITVPLLLAALVQEFL